MTDTSTIGVKGYTTCCDIYPLRAKEQAELHKFINT